MEVKRVLLADDDIDLRDAYVYLLESHGYEVIAAVNGLDALRYCNHSQIDVAILANQMPHMNGVDVCAEVSAFLPVIIWSGEDCAKEAIASGAMRFISKDRASIESILCALTEIG